MLSLAWKQDPRLCPLAMIIPTAIFVSLTVATDVLESAARFSYSRVRRDGWPGIEIVETLAHIGNSVARHPNLWVMWHSRASRRKENVTIYLERTVVLEWYIAGEDVLLIRSNEEHLPFVATGPIHRKWGHEYISPVEQSSIMWIRNLRGSGAFHSFCCFPPWTADQH